MDLLTEKKSRFTENDSSLSIASREDLLHASKAIHDEAMSSMKKELARTTKELREEALASSLTLKARNTKSIHDHNAKIARMERKLSSLEDRIKGIESSVKEGMVRITNLLKNLPIPKVEVSVPEMKPPEVVVNVPESSFQVNVPELKSPNIQVIVPPRKKRISYDQAGRPVEITEE